MKPNCFLSCVSVTPNPKGIDGHKQLCDPPLSQGLCKAVVIVSFPKGNNVQQGISDIK
jgi:hypothetical protein